MSTELTFEEWCANRSFPRYAQTDLEFLCTLIDVAAIYLTPEPGALFTDGELMAEWRLA